MEWKHYVKESAFSELEKEKINSNSKNLELTSLLIKEQSEKLLGLLEQGKLKFEPGYQIRIDKDGNKIKILTEFSLVPNLK